MGLARAPRSPGRGGRCPLWLELRDTWSLRHSLVAGASLAVFVAVVVGGYLGDWDWTGFRGNTLWNWLQLWLLPLLIPAVALPLVRPRAMSGVVVLDEGNESAGATPTAHEHERATHEHERATPNHERVSPVRPTRQDRAPVADDEDAVLPEPMCG